MDKTLQHIAPVAIGGVGGSGTRLIANLLLELGFNLGFDLNQASDNLWFTLLLKRAELWPPEDNAEEIQNAYRIFKRAMTHSRPLAQMDLEYIHSLCRHDRPNHSVAWLKQRADSLATQTGTLQAPLRNYKSRWGWKEPNTHIFLPALVLAEPKLSYIHVIRHGLDMAYSANQNQLKLWGRFLLYESPLPDNPETSFRYWCAAHRRLHTIKEAMGPRFLMLDYDQLCKKPEPRIRELLNFLDVEPTTATVDSLKGLIKPPKTIGRHQLRPLSNISKEDLAVLMELGYSTDHL